VSLAAGQGAAIPAQKWQVRREFLSKRHFRWHSLMILPALLGAAVFRCNPGPRSPGWSCAIPRCRLETLEQSTALLVSTLRLGGRSDEIDEVQAGDIGARQRFFGPLPLLGANRSRFESLVRPGEGD